MSAFDEVTAFRKGTKEEVTGYYFRDNKGRHFLVPIGSAVKKIIFPGGPRSVIDNVVEVEYDIRFEGLGH